MATVWVAYRDNGYEGHSEPIRVFANQADAELWLAGASDNYGSGAKVKDFEVYGTETYEWTGMSMTVGEGLKTTKSGPKS